MATPYDAPIPGADTYATAALGAKTAYQNTLARINAKRGDTLRQYGYLGDIDPNTGVVNNVRVDPYNQFGGLQQMLRGNAGAVEQARFASEERGLHGGLAHKALSDVHYDLGNASQQLGSSFAGALGGYQDDQNQATYQRDQALYQAELDAARLAVQNGDFNPSDTTDTSGGNPSGVNTPYGAGMFDNLNKLSPEDWARIAALPVNQKKAAPGAVPYIHSPGLNQTAAARTTTAATKLVAAAKKKKGGK